MRGALEKMAGIGKIDIKIGDPDFTIHFDSKKVSPDVIVKALVAAGEKGAKVKA